jgi:hypothetical protein
MPVADAKRTKRALRRALNSQFSGSIGKEARPPSIIPKFSSRRWFCLALGQVTIGQTPLLDGSVEKGMTMAKKNELDPETLALIEWCTQVEPFLVAGGATLTQAQDHIEDEVEWFTDQFYDGLTPEEAAKAALA